MKIIKLFFWEVLRYIVYDESGYHDNSSFNSFLESIGLTEEELLDFTKQFYEINIKKALRG